MRRLIHILLAFMLVCLIFGCSGGTNDPVTPAGINDEDEGKPEINLEPVGPAQPIAVKKLQGVDLRVPLGFYTFTADPEKGKLEVVSQRTASQHLNGVPLLEQGPGALLQVSGAPHFSNGGKQLDVDIRISHPNANAIYTVFDVHGIFMSEGSVIGWEDVEIKIAGPEETRLLNPDGYSRWWNPKEFTHLGLYGYNQGDLGGYLPAADAAILNGYKTFGDGLTPMSELSDLDPALRGMFSAESNCTRHYTIWFGGGFTFNYAVDASWAFPTSVPPVPPGDFPLNANMPEPYWVQVEEWNNTLWYEEWEGSGGNVFYHITVHDWQGKNTFGTIRVEIPGININETAWDLIEEGDNYRKYDYRVVLPIVTSNEDLDMLLSVDSSEGDYQPALTGVNKPLKAYTLHRTIVADENPIYNQIPVVVMFPATPPDIVKDQSVTFDASQSYDPDGQIIEYEWDFNGDGYYGDVYDSGSPAKPVRVYHNYGNFNVKVRVKDNNNAVVVSEVVLVNVTAEGNLMPFSIAEATTTTEIMSDETVTFDASASYDIDGTIDQYLWDFDGDAEYGDEYASGTDINPTVSWPAGEYDVDLKVIDNEAGTDTLEETIHVTVGNYPPMASATPTTSTDIYSGESVSFDASASNDVDGTVDLYEWDFDGDLTYGDSYESGDDIMPTRAYPEPGEFDIDLRVTDNLGVEDTLEVTLHVSVTNPPPIADAYAVTSTSIAKNGTVEFDASGSSDINGTVDIFEWDFDGDLNYGDTYDFGTDINPIKVFSSAGTFNVSLRVVDNNGAEDFLDVPIQVDVSNTPPIACAEFAASPPYYFNTFYDISADCSTDSDGTLVDFEWDLDYNGVTFNPTGNGQNISVFWPVEGTYDIMLRVWDDDGGFDFLDDPITVEILWVDNLPPIIDSIDMSRTTTLKNSESEAITLTCIAHDPNVSDTLTYEWTADEGYFMGATDQQVAVWVSPNVVSHQTVKCRVYDDYSAWDEMESDMIRVTQYPEMLPKPWPDYTSDLMFSDDTYTLSDYTPGTVVLINFWATWCPPCIAEMPHLQGVMDNYTSDVFTFISSSGDAAEATAENWVNANPYNFTVWGWEGSGWPILNMYGPWIDPTGYVPDTVIIDRDGAVRYSKVGSISNPSQYIVIIDEMI